MSKTQNNYNVLIQVQSQNEAERIISMFRSAGITTRAHRVTSEEDLIDSLKNDSWHLLIADNRHPQVSLPYSLDALKKHEKDTPIILLTDDLSAETQDRAFKLGVQDVIDKAAESHFTHAALREMNNAQERAKSRELAVEFAELNARAEQLLANSDDAVAYVTDGIIMKCNAKFAESFGTTLEQLDFASIIDLVADSDHKKFKNFFRLFGKGELEKAELTFQALKNNADTFEAFISLSESSIDGEPCTQVNLSNNASGSSNASGAGTQDVATELYNRYYLADQIAVAAMQAGNNSSSLLVYALDDYENLLDEAKFSGIDTLIKDLAAQLAPQFTSGETIARLTDNSVAIITQQKPDAALKVAKKSLAVVEKHICEMQERTFQYTCTCAVLHINNKNASIVLDNAIVGISDIRLNKAKNSADTYTPPVVEAAPVGANDVANIAEALEHGVFKLLYQPMMSLQGDSKENYEVSVWMNDNGTDVYPDALIQNANNSKLDRWIILESTKALSMHRAAGHNTRLTINLTLNALMDNGLAAWLKVATKAANLTNDLLVFQFNEEDIRKHLKSAIKTINALHEAKFQVSVNHFGKESDPFKLLNHIKIDMIRIDPHFTELIAKGDTNELKVLINKSKELSIQTLLPEVDNAGALATLWQLGTHYIQGSYLQVPTPVMNYEFADIA
jgi:EAL domain-containing protein (putative c-di-GMP-specific phosphodiesterase class I)/PleD family two-component response regulator